MPFKKTIGSRAEVFHGVAKHTSGGLEKKHLLKNKAGQLVSKAKHLTAKKEKRLEKYGYFAKKGQFGYVKKTPKDALKKTIRKKTLKKKNTRKKL